MRYADDIGFVWKSMARIYDLCAYELHRTSHSRSLIAHPQLTDSPAFELKQLERVEADFYDTSRTNRPLLAEVVQRHGIKQIVYMGCDPPTIELSWLKTLGVRTINYEQDSYPPNQPQSLWKRLGKQLLRRQLKWNLHDLYIANADHQRQFLLDYAQLPINRVITVVNGVDTNYFTPGPAPDPALFGLPRTDFYALCVCQARPEKRVEFLIDVAADIFRIQPSLSLTFVHVGSGECLNDWRQKAETLGLSSRFHFVGFQNDVLPFHRLATFLVHAAERESFGYVLAESMACGKPVIVTNSPGPSEIIEEGRTGYCVNREDTDLFAQRILQLAADPALCAQLGANALQAANSRFDIRRQATELASAISRPTIREKRH